jgi:hypothetical protein
MKLRKQADTLKVTENHSYDSVYMRNRNDEKWLIAACSSDVDEGVITQHAHASSLLGG